MSRVCEICGKGPISGHTITTRGLKKRKGGIGLHITGVNRRKFLPNLQKIRVREGGGCVTRKVCVECIKRGKVQKA